MMQPQTPPADGRHWLPRCCHGACMAWGVYGESSRGPWWCGAHLQADFLPGRVAPQAPNAVPMAASASPAMTAAAAQGALL